MFLNEENQFPRLSINNNLIINKNNINNNDKKINKITNIINNNELNIINNKNEEETNNKKQDNNIKKINNNSTEEKNNNNNKIIEYNLNKNKNENKKIILKILPIKQEEEWDCGLACAKMILNAYNVTTSNFDIVCETLGINTSVWTVDIAYILKHYKIKSTFKTIYTGVDKRYMKDPFYKEYYDEDVDRIENLFKEAKPNKVNIEKKSVTMGDIINHLRNYKPIIILINWIIVKSSKEGNVWCFKSLYRRFSGYEGHFIVLTGVSANGDYIYYLNPQKSSVKLMDVEVMEDARKSFGTDQDIIFINQSTKFLNHLRGDYQLEEEED